MSVDKKGKKGTRNNPYTLEEYYSKENDLLENKLKHLETFIGKVGQMTTVTGFPTEALDMWHSAQTQLFVDLDDDLFYLEKLFDSPKPKQEQQPDMFENANQYAIEPDWIK